MTRNKPTDICGRCGHDRDTHWYSGFVCHDCGCTLFRKKPAEVTAMSGNGHSDAANVR